MCTHAGEEVLATDDTVGDGACVPEPRLESESNSSRGCVMTETGCIGAVEWKIVTIQHEANNVCCKCQL